MSTVSRLLPLLVAAILAASAWALPSAALAHAGHDHRNHAVAAASAGQHAAMAVKAARETAQPEAPAARPAFLSSSSKSPDAAECDGAFCCGVAGSGCCSGLLSAGHAQVPLPATTAGALGITWSGGLTGSDPDTPLKPPKSFV